MMNRAEREKERKEELLRDGVHKALSREEAERYVAALSDEEVILLDALLASLG